MATQTIQRGATTLGSPNADDVINVIGGTASIVTNMDWSGVTQADTIKISPEFTGDFGTSASPFKGKVNVLFRYAAQGGSSYWVSDGSASDVSARLLMPAGTGGHLHFETTGTCTLAEVASGKFTIGTAVVVTTLYIGASGDVRFYDDSSTDPTLVVNSGGTLYLDRGATTLTHNGGVSNIQGPSANAITTLNVNGRGVNLVESGTITTLNAFGGIPNASKLTRALTITTANVNMSLPGATDFLDHYLITVGTTNKYLG